MSEVSVGSESNRTLTSTDLKAQRNAMNYQASGQFSDCDLTSKIRLRFPKL